MTTLAIIGSGILGRSLIYSLAKEQKPLEKITLFYSDNIVSPCTYHSTAIVAPRGLSGGLSPLGDMLIDGLGIFSNHVEMDQPAGVEKIIQYTAATKKIDEFKKRYPAAIFTKKNLKSETLMATDDAYLIEPKTYSDWLLSEALFLLDGKIDVIEDFVTELDEKEFVHLKTLNGKQLAFDKVIFAGGSYNAFWKNVSPESKLKTSKAVQGSYFEFNQVDWKMDSFSLTVDGDNLVWNKTFKKLLIGSTSVETNHLLPPLKALTDIYLRLESLCDLNLPPMATASIKVGLREKAQKREPYMVDAGKKYFLGGLYKNGFSLALKIARNFSHQHL